MRPRLFRLLELHQRIDEALRRELRRHWPDPFKVSRLRKKKVRVKHRLTPLTPRLRSA
jgi:hypothetical protein